MESSYPFRFPSPTKPFFSISAFLPPSSSSSSTAIFRSRDRKHAVLREENGSSREKRSRFFLLGQKERRAKGETTRSTCVTQTKRLICPSFSAQVAREKRVSDEDGLT